MNRMLLWMAGGLLLASTAMAGEKKLMHCFAFTAQEKATPAEWDAFYKATDELPKKIKGLSQVWYGKLASPLKVGSNVRQYGVCMEMADQSVREDYGRNPAHDEWNKAYVKVMVPGTTTFDIVGQ